MESFPVQSPEISTDDDDDESFVSVREKKDSRSENSKAAGKQEQERPESELAADKESKKLKNEEGEIPLESLADDELRLVAQQYINDRAEALKNEIINVSEDSPEEAAALANASLLEAIETKLSQGEDPSEQTLVQATAETAQELDIELMEADEPAQTDEFNETDAVAEIEDHEEQPAPTDPQAVSPAAAATAGSSSSKAATGSPAAPATPGPTPGSPGSPAGGNNLPPVTPTRSYGGVPPINPNYNVNNPVANPNTPNTPENVIVKHNAAAPYLLLGYLIGRRRGRIKTEEKLLPVQKKLEKEVSDLRMNIAAEEEKIRKMAREKAETTPGVSAKIAERIEKRKKTEVKSEAAPSAEKELKIKPEKLGMLAVTKETPEDKLDIYPKIPATESKLKTPEPIKVPERPKDPTNMSVAELLVIAAHIPTEHGNVKKLYENHLLTEQALREATEAYLKGERYETIVRNNRASTEAIGGKNLETEPASSRYETHKAANISLDTEARRGQTRVAGPSLKASSGASADGSSQSSGQQPAKPVSRMPASALVSAAVLLAVVLLLFLLRR